jgi:hypothetical protein
MKYIVERLNEQNLWIKDNEYPEEKYAVARCYELTNENAYTEPSGNMKKGFFGTHNENEPWVCRIALRASK